MRAFACAVALIGCFALSAGLARAQDPNYPDTGVDANARAALWYNNIEVVIPLTTEVVNGVEISKAEDWYYYQPGEFELRLNEVVFDPDPVITYNFAFIDFGGPSAFQLVFSQNILATAAPGSASHNMAGASATGASLTANAPLLAIPVDSDGTPEIAVYTLSTNGGVTLLSAGMDLGPSAAIPIAGVYGPFAEGPIGGPAASGSYDHMRIDISFGLGGSNQAFTASGLATIEEQAPEPAAFWLLGTGLGLIALRRRGLPS